MKKYPLLLVMLFLLVTCKQSTNFDYAKNETPEQKNARMQWWKDAKFGMFIHWGGYSHLGGVYKGDTINGIAEWLQFYKKIPADEYAGLIKGFNPVKYNPEEWAKLAKDAGMKYLVITSKHHEGLAMWDSKVTDFDIVDFSTYGKDVLKPLAVACRKNDVKFGTYHSILDWHYAEAKGDSFHLYRDKILKPQLKEIMEELDPEVMWFDGEWIPEWTEEQGVEVYNYLRNMKPDLIINNRVGKGRDGMQGMNKEGAYVGDFGTPEQEILSGASNLDWESCMTMNDTWGFKYGDTNWKSSKTLIHNLIDVVSKGGNYLLNVGPTAEGLIPQESINRLMEIGKWLKINGEAIYATKRAEHYKDAESIRYIANKDNKTIYALSMEWPGDTLSLKYYKPDENSEIYLLGYPTALSWDYDLSKGLSINIPSELQSPENWPCKHAFVFKIIGQANEVTPVPDIISNDKINPDKLLFTESILIECKNDGPNLKIYYTTDGSEPNANSDIYTEPLILEKSGIFKCFAAKEGKVNSIARAVEIIKTDKFNNIELVNPFSENYAAEGELTLIDLERASENFKDGKWLGFEGVDFEVIVDLAKEKHIKLVKVGFLHQSGSWIFYPENISFYSSKDGKNFKKVKEINNPITKSTEDGITDFTAELNQNARHLKIKAKNMGVCPLWHAGSGGKAWLFVDEIIVE